MSVSTDSRAVTSNEVSARLAAALGKLPTKPKTRAQIAEALAPTVTALIAEAQHTASPTPKDPR